MPTDIVDGQLLVHKTVGLHGGGRLIDFLLGVAFYNAVEVVVLVLSTFRRWRGLYFWSLLMSASLGVVPFSLSLGLMHVFQSRSLGFPIMGAIGAWVLSISLPLVLYSRLFLVLHSRRILRVVLCMIIINFLGPGTLSVAGTCTAWIINTQESASVSKIFRAISYTVLMVQEACICALYIWPTTKLLCLNPRPANRLIMWQLISMNAVIVSMNLVSFVLECVDYPFPVVVIKIFFDSVKLKLELAILGRLVQVAQAHQRPSVIEDALSPITLECSSSPTNSAAPLTTITTRNGASGVEERGGNR